MEICCRLVDPCNGVANDGGDGGGDRPTRMNGEDVRLERAATESGNDGRGENVNLKWIKDVKIA